MRRRRKAKGQKAPPPQTVLAAPPTPPKLPRHSSRFCPVLFKESGTAFAAGHAIKCPYSRGRHWEEGWRVRCAAAELRQWFCGPAYRSLSTLVVAGCWLLVLALVLDNRLTALLVALATCNTYHCWRRRQREGRAGLHVRKPKPRRGGGIPDIFLGHCAVCARVGEESVN
jgi:hypothetical protein